MTSPGGILPPLRWSALGLDVAQGSILVANFDGDVILNDDILPGRELLEWLDGQRSLGIDLIATPTLPQGIVGSLAHDTRAAELLVPLDDWSLVLGIRPAVVDPSLSAIANRLAHVYERLVHLDPSILQYALNHVTNRTGGEPRLLKAALAHGNALHPGTTTPLELMFLGNRPKPERLKLRKDGDPVDPDSVARLFAPNGPIASHYSAWEERPQQTQLARRVAETLSEGGETITEAGTGTGKSLAYLIPALLHATQTGEQIVVATNTRVLQDQLAFKDAPIAIDAVRTAYPDTDPTVHVLKGRSNYLCLRRWFAETGAPPPVGDDSSSQFRTRATIWLAVTESGERSELNLDREAGRAFDRVSAEGEACDASTCKFQQRNQCFLYRARRQADSAHVVITNHALLLTDVVQGGEALPEAKHLIIDEAHHLEDQATSSFQTAVSMRIVTAALNLLMSDGRRTSGPGLLAEVDGFFGSRILSTMDEIDRSLIRNTIGSANRQATAVRSAAEQLFQDLASLVTRHGDHARDYASRMRLTAGIRGGGDWSDIERKWDVLNLAMVGLVADLSELQRQLPDLSRLEMDVQEAEKATLRVEDLENRLGVARHT
ncbi:MAG TPA: DEAD/DEAH box helicase, partial [Thermomicrobiales bacterium]|nr:DEAD/DEAH box helicase [Thermomicrobiales bacterium]